MKTYVITISKVFPCYHPKKGEKTGFVVKMINKEKKHTIRGNYQFWKKRIDEVNAGNAILSVRQWLGKPYYSNQHQLFKYCKGEVGIQKCSVGIINGNEPFIHVNDVHVAWETMNAIIANDGLEKQDFCDWFKKPIKDGCIIHFTDLRY